MANFREEPDCRGRLMTEDRRRKKTMHILPDQELTEGKDEILFLIIMQTGLPD
ncbi:MAG: hypothetical protein GYA41_13810 [Bacteroidales bacterium]|nr:hypothetical protein [Bacteroidales bacterium]